MIDLLRKGERICVSKWKCSRRGVARERGKKKKKKINVCICYEKPVMMIVTIIDFAWLTCCCSCSVFVSCYVLPLQPVVCWQKCIFEFALVTRRHDWNSRRERVRVREQVKCSREEERDLGGKRRKIRRRKWKRNKTVQWQEKVPCIGREWQDKRWSILQRKWLKWLARYPPEKE